MAIIMRSSGQRRDQSDNRKQIYTWVGCGLVMVLTLISVIPNMGGENKPDYSKFSSQRQQDLAALPFGTDADADNFLRNNPEYANISNADLLGSLFSSEDKEERQAKDKAEGVPPPPDPEYAEIIKEKEKAEEAQSIRESRIQRKRQAKEDFDKEAKRIKNKRDNKTTGKQASIRKQNEKTTPGSLASRGGGFSSGGGSSSVTGSIWRNEGGNKNGQVNSTPVTNNVTAQDMAFVKGRSADLYRAGVESMKGANADSAESAAVGAMNAFQDGVTPEGLEKDEQDLGLEEPLGVSSELQNDLARSIGDEVNKQEAEKKEKEKKENEYNINENCLDNKGHLVWSCVGMNLFNKVLDAGINCVTSGCWTGWKGDSVSNGVFKDGEKTWLMGKEGEWQCVKGC